MNCLPVLRIARAEPSPIGRYSGHEPLKVSISNGSTSTMVSEATAYNLVPGLSLGRIEEQYYTFDAGLGTRRLLRHRTRPISKYDAHLIRAIAEIDLPASLDAILRQLADLNTTIGDLEALVERSMLIPHAHPDNDDTSESFSRGVYAERFTQRDMARKLCRETFFNTPSDSDSLAPSVGLKGVPLASVSKNKGVEAAPDYLRHISSELANWFEIHRDGVFTDLCLGQGLPTIGHDLVIADLGNFDFEGDDLSTIFRKIKQSVESDFLGTGVKPIFIGGDHAVTFPIVDAIHAQKPDLGVIHLDAHHDFFFGEQIQYSHASVIANLVFHTGIEAIYSFGLRARADLVGQTTSNLLSLPHAAQWWQRASSINDTRRYLMSPTLLDSLLGQDKERPFYLTIDLDVLSPEAISGRAMTPVPEGLSWSELFALLELLFERLNIVGCDLTELNPYCGSANADTEEWLCLLLIYLIEKLGRRYEKTY